jgi:hypothetical protein
VKKADEVSTQSGIGLKVILEYCVTLSLYTDLAPALSYGSKRGWFVSMVMGTYSLAARVDSFIIFGARQYRI